MEGAKDIKCPSCGWTQVRFRIKTNDWHCYHCNYSWKDEVKEDE